MVLTTFHSASNPELADLPLSLSPDHKIYWNAFVGEPFQNHIGPRGKKSSNARTWTREMFTGDFCDRFFESLSPSHRLEYEAVLGPVSPFYLSYVLLLNV
jgi:hypothetical protein